jgi:ABC-type phosphate transport system substrate-binding protein
MSLALAAPAHADYAPSGSDAVGVGSDTVQYLMDFGADGDTHGDLGYNSAGNINKLVSFDATPDANARAAYQNGSTTTALLPLSPTVVLRAGTSPVLRPNGSSAGIAALLADTSKEINFVRASRLPNSGEEGDPRVPAFGGLHVVRLGNEDLELAAATTTDAVPLSASQLFHVYQCDAGFTTWAGTGIGGASAATIVPIIPQNGSGTRSTFLADIEAGAGQTTITLGGCVKTAEENDPTAITSGNFGTPKDAIEPFSGSRLKLYNSGYFHAPGTSTFPAGAALSAGIKLETGTVTKGGTAYDDNRGLFIVFRQSDLASTKPFQAGGTKNLIQTFFSGTSPYFKSAAGQALVAAAGATPAYKDCGVNPTSCGETHRWRRGCGRIPAATEPATRPCPIPNTDREVPLKAQHRHLLRVAVSAATAGFLFWAGVPGAQATTTPYHDVDAIGGITLCSQNGAQLLSGSVTAKPFAWRAVNSTAAPTSYRQGGTATLYAFQPRLGVDPGDWSGEQLTSSSRYTVPAHPTAAATYADGSLASFLGDFPATWKGYVQLRMYLGAPGQVPSTVSYDTADLQVSGDTWRLLKGGPADCASAGHAVSLESVTLPAKELARAKKAAQDVAAPAPGRPRASAAPTRSTSVTMSTPTPAVAAAQAAASSPQSPDSRAGLWHRFSVLVAVLALLGAVSATLALRRRS